MSARAVPGASSNQMPHSAHCRNRLSRSTARANCSHSAPIRPVRHDVQAEPLALGIPEQTRRGAPLQLLVDRALDVVERRLDEIARDEASEHVIAEMRAGDPGPLHTGRRLGQLPVRQLGVAEDLNAAAVFRPEDHSLEPADVTVAGRLPDVDGKAHHQDLVVPGGQGLPGANRGTLGVGLVIERDLLGDIAAERTEAIGERLDAVVAGLGIGEDPEQPGNSASGRYCMTRKPPAPIGRPSVRKGRRSWSAAPMGCARPSGSRLRRPARGTAAGCRA